MIRNLNVPLFLLALAIAAAIKLTVHDRQALSERVLDAQVTYSTPAPDLVSYDLLDKVKLAVRAPADDLSELSVFTVEVLATIPPGRTGPTEIVLEEDDVRFGKGGRFEVLSIDPNRFTIQVERRVEKTVPVRAQLFGEPVAGARHGEPTVRPPQVLVSGPRSKVEPVSELSAPVSLDGHGRSFQESVVLTSPDPLVQVVRPKAVTVTVPMEDPELSFSFDQLPPEDGS